MTKKKLDPDYAKRMLQAFIQRHEIDIGKASVDIETALHKGNLNQVFLIESQTRDHKIRIQIYKLALAQLEEQEKCCANCADWGEGRDKEIGKKYPCESRKIYDLHEEYGYIVTPPDFYCGYWRKDV